MKNGYEIRGAETAIFIKHKGKRYETLIDTLDLAKVLSFPNTWRIRHLRTTNSYYAQGNIRAGDRYRTVHLHRWIFDEPIGMEIDHRNNNGLDNRRSSNLRVATKSQNGQNRKGPQVNNKSGVRGVCWHGAARKWIVQVNVDGVRHYGGLHESLKAAERTACRIRRENMPFSKEASKSS